MNVNADPNKDSPPDPAARAAPRHGPRASGEWAQLADPLKALLDAHGVLPEVIDGWTGRFLAVPLGANFSKPRTNVLLHRPRFRQAAAIAFVDADLTYQGPDRPDLVRAFEGACANDWRRLLIAPLRGDINQALCTLLGLLDSPLAGPAALAAAGSAGDESTGDGSPGDGGQIDPLLLAVGRFVMPPQAADAFERTFRKELAEQLAMAAACTAPPRCGVIWGRSGCGKDVLLEAAAHPLLARGRVERVLRISGGHVAAGCIFPGEMDAALMRVLDAAAGYPNWLFLLADLDVCVSGTSVSLSLLCEAIDGGLHLLATARSEAALARLGSDTALARRALAVRLPPPPSAQVGDALRRIAQAAGVQVAPEALAAVLRLTRDDEACEPASSIGLLTASIAQAADAGGQVDPDAVFAMLRSEWPTENTD